MADHLSMSLDALIKSDRDASKAKERARKAAAAKKKAEAEKRKRAQKLAAEKKKRAADAARQKQLRAQQQLQAKKKAAAKLRNRNARNGRTLDAQPYLVTSNTQRRGGRAAGRGAPPPAQSSVVEPTNKIMVSNLAESVSQADVEDLFGELGKLEAAFLAFDANGKSTGVAHVTYANARNATQAYNRYNGVALDGQNMLIEYVGAVKRLSVHSRLA